MRLSFPEGVARSIERFTTSMTPFNQLLETARLLNAITQYLTIAPIKRAEKRRIAPAMFSAFENNCICIAMTSDNTNVLFLPNQSRYHQKTSMDARSILKLFREFVPREIARLDGQITAIQDTVLEALAEATAEKPACLDHHLARVRLLLIKHNILHRVTAEYDEIAGLVRVPNIQFDHTTSFTFGTLYSYLGPVTEDASVAFGPTITLIEYGPTLEQIYSGKTIPFHFYVDKHRKKYWHVDMKAGFPRDAILAPFGEPIWTVKKPIVKGMVTFPTVWARPVPGVLAYGDLVTLCGKCSYLQHDCHC